MTYLIEPARALLRRQHGVASLHQLIDCGISEPQIRVLERNGVLVSVMKGACRSSLVVEDDLVRCAAVCVTRPDAAIAGPTAGRLWNFRKLPRDGRIHVLLPPGGRGPATPWSIAYRTGAIHPEDIVRRDDGIAVTTRQRTVFDLARSVNRDVLLSLAEQAMLEGNLGESDMRSVAVDWRSPRCRWVDDYLRVLDRRLPGGPAESHPEVRVGSALRRVGVRNLVRQHEVVLSSGRRVRFDLAIPNLRIAVEIDLHPVHASTVGTMNDEQRDIDAEHDGWITLRITASEYQNAFEQRIDEIAAAIRLRATAA
jgi:very-short-patch-repair endonuclease